jgi:HPt (histidine-containing phosphotransfer) domain-containing protein
MTWTPAVLTERLGGDEHLVRELVDIFLAEYPKLLHAVRTSASQGDGPALRRAAHALRGSITNFIDDGPTVTALALERAGEESRLDDAARLFIQLEREVEELATAMRSFHGNRPCAS